MNLSWLYNIIGTDARNTFAQRVGHDRTGLCENAPSIQHETNSELRIAALCQTYWGSRTLSAPPPEMSRGRLPLPPPTPGAASVWCDQKKCESCIDYTAPCGIPAVIVTFDSNDIMFCNLMWESGRFRSSAMLLDIHCRPGTKYVYASTRTWRVSTGTSIPTLLQAEYEYQGYILLSTATLNNMK